MKNIFKMMASALAIIGGIFAADMVKTNVGASYDSGAEKEGAHQNIGESKVKKANSKVKKASKDGGVSAPHYIKFNRQFVVPVVAKDSVQSLVILNINIEISEEAPSNSYAYEPKLRDAMTRELLAIANEGHFDANLTTPQTYEVLRTRLFNAVEPILGEHVHDVLILDLARQDT